MDIAVYSDTLAEGWMDWSWGISPNYANAAPVHSGSKSIAVRYTSGWSGVQLGRYDAIQLSGHHSLRFWIHGGSAGGQQFQVYVARGDAACETIIKTVYAQAETWSMVEIPLDDLGNPGTVANIQFFNNSSNSQPVFYIDDISFIPGNLTPPKQVLGPLVSIDGSAKTHQISPLIYGMNFAEEALASELRLPINRWGGNATTRYNWQADTSNRAKDWYFENIPNDNPHPENLPNGSASDSFVEQNRRTSTETLLTIPLIGFTPKSGEYACGFRVSKYGAQDDVDPYRPDCGNGISNGAYITGNDPSDTSIAIGPQFVSDWIDHLKSRYGSANQGGVTYYNFDNEPMLWHDTHRDVHPQPTGYDEILERTIQYASAVKAADPAAQTLGPVLWGWTAYFYSALDQAGGGAWWDVRPDRKAHGDLPFLTWYLQQMHAYQQSSGMRLLDFVDLHYYPQGTSVFSDAVDPQTAALRLRSTRSLWDPTYSDESWIDEPVYLIPRMRDWVSANYPGTKLAVTEYNFGALCSLNGALAQADVLGIFGREKLDLATIWDPPSSDEPGAFAFRLYRNYDGLGSAFGETNLTALTTDHSKLSVFAALRARDQALTLIFINKTATDLASPIQISNFSSNGRASVYQYSHANLGSIQKMPDQAIGATPFNTVFPANSITLWVISPGTPAELPFKLYLSAIKR